MSFSLLLLAVAVKNYKKEKDRSSVAARISLVVPFILSTSLLPLSLLYLRLFYPFFAFHTYAGLDKLYGLSAGEIVWLFMLGQYVNFDVGSALIFGLGSLLGFFGIINCLRSDVKQGSNKINRISVLFLFMGFLMVLVDYRILKLLIVGIPFTEERLWVFQDLMAAPFVAIVASSVIVFLRKKTSNALSKVRLPFSTMPLMQVKMNSKSVVTFTSLSTCVVAYVMIFTLLSGWITMSVYYGYPHWAPLQTTPYELEAVKYIDKNTTERYIVICDLWMTYAGGIIVGLNNPRAFYFFHTDPRGVALYGEMEENPSSQPMIEAMKINNATTAYFIIEKGAQEYDRLDTEEYNRIIQQAQQKELQTYKIFYYPEGEEKLRIFYYKK